MKKKFNLPSNIISNINIFLGKEYWKNRRKLSFINLLIDYMYSNWYTNIKDKLNWKDWNMRNKNIIYNPVIENLPIKFNKLYNTKRTSLMEIDVLDFLEFKIFNNRVFIDFKYKKILDTELRKLHIVYFNKVYN